jgi:hypothetical protein
MIFFVEILGVSINDVTVKIDFFDSLPLLVTLRHLFSLETYQKSYGASQISDPPPLEMEEGWSNRPLP